MMNHGLVRACERPEAVVVDEHSVWVASEVQSVTVRDESGEHTEYEFNLVQYEKDEFIPDMKNHEIYAEIFNEVYSKLYKRLDGVYKREKFIFKRRNKE